MNESTSKRGTVGSGGTPTRGDRDLLRRRRWRWVTAGLAAGMLLTWLGAGSRGPQYRGRSVESWFREACATEARAFYSGGHGYDEEGWLRFRTAMVALGTNAVPLLLEAAFRFEDDSALGSGLFRLSLALPRSWGVLPFTPRRYRPDTALALLREIRPPASWVVPVVDHHFRSTNVLFRRQALEVLGTIGEGADQVVGRLADAITNQSRWSAPTEPVEPLAAVNAILSLGTRASNSLPAMVSVMNMPSRKGRIANWLAGLGAAAATAVPNLEDQLTSTNHGLRCNAAVSLLHIDPTHAEALRVVTEAADLAHTPADAAFNLGHPRWALLTSVARGPRRPCGVLLPIVEPLARAEVASWATGVDGDFATRALERIAPGEAERLYRGAMTGPAAVRAAARLLRLQGADPVATQVLAEALASSGPQRETACGGLAQASPTNRVAVEALEREIGRSSTDKASAAARGARERIRYREAREARGLPETD